MDPRGLCHELPEKTDTMRHELPEEPMPLELPRNDEALAHELSGEEVLCHEIITAPTTASTRPIV